MDNFVVSARKYRPDVFSSVIGQENITRTLKNSIVLNQIAHAYLFCGPRGVGKTTCARIFAKVINCLNPTSDHEPCNECDSCNAFNRAGSFNIHELDAASNNSVEDIRSLIEKVRIPPQIGRFSVYIIDEVHMLSSSAFNAFLKTLEEPPAHAMFILATTEKHKILPTILSRCQVYDFNRITVPDIATRLSYVAQSEGVTIESDALNVIAQKADGALRDALSIFDQIVSFSGKTVTYEQVLKNLNVLDYEYFFRVTDQLFKGNIPDALLALDEIITRGFDPQYFIAGFIKHFRDLMVARVPETVKLLEVGDHFRERYAVQSKSLSLSFIYKAMDICNECDVQYKSSSNKRLLVELTMVRIAQLTAPAETPVQQPVIKDTTVAVAAPVKPTAATGARVLEDPVPYQPKPQQPDAGKTPVSPVVQTISIKKINQQSKPAGQEKTAAETEKNVTELNADALAKCWKEYAEKIKEDNPTLSVSMLSHQPAISSEGKIVVTIESELQKNEIIRNFDVLRKLLATEFGPRSWEFDLVLIEAEIKKTVFTDSDKIKYLTEKYPHFDNFRKRFGLEVM